MEEEKPAPSLLRISAKFPIWANSMFTRFLRRLVCMTELRIETVNVNSLTPDPSNARKHDGKNLQAIAHSLEKFGQRKPIVVTPDSIVVAGNGTLEAAKSLGWTEIAIARTPIGWTWDQIKAFALADNRTAELAEWDDKVLADQLLELDANGWELEELGFENLEPPTSSDADDDDPLSFDNAPTKAKIGDIWKIGNQTIACGDSTNSTFIQKVLNGNNPDVVFTDPPYGIGYKAMRGGKDIANDASPNEALEVTIKALQIVSNTKTFFACCDWRSLETMISVYQQIGIEPKCTIVWDKESRVQNLDRYAKQHEFILYSGPYGGNETVATDIWKFKRDFEPDHPTPKPVPLVSFAIETSSKKGQIVYDPFCGSGATLVACQRTDRVGYGIELDPKYVDVILSRLEKQTGLEAQLLED
jgi:DNA modification methylase